MLPTVRAQPTTFSPCWTKARATAAPMPPEAPVTSASRSRHRSMPALAMAPSRPPTSLKELRPWLERLGLSLVTVPPAAANLLAFELRLDPPPCWLASGLSSALRSSAPGHIPPEEPSGPAPRPCAAAATPLPVSAARSRKLCPRRLPDSCAASRAGMRASKAPHSVSLTCSRLLNSG